MNTFNIFNRSINCFPDITFPGGIYIDCSKDWSINFIRMNLNFPSKQGSNTNINRCCPFGKIDALYLDIIAIVNCVLLLCTNANSQQR